MKRHIVREFGRISRKDLGRRLASSLQAFDEGFAKKNSDTVFDWSRRDDVIARNYVGVVEVPSGIVEILPKIDWVQDDSIDEATLNRRAQSNLLYMLSLTRNLPIRHRDLAHLTTNRQPLLETLITLFATRLIEELRKGADHAYIRRQEDLPYIKGRFLVKQQILRNIVHRERVACEYDDFLPDTWLNRVLKAACAKLIRLTQSSWTARCLREAMVYLASVREMPIFADRFTEIQLDRNNERFHDLVTFAKIVLLDTAPAPQAGERRSFSLLFPMDSLFEQFIGEFIVRHALEFGVERSQVRLQTRGRRRWLLRDEHTNQGRFRLIPDIHIGDSSVTSLVIDTKWKQLVPDSEDPKNGVSQTDLYQLYTYAERYECADNVLLYPAVHGVTGRCYHVDGGRRQQSAFRRST